MERKKDRMKITKSLRREKGRNREREGDRVRES